MSETPGINVLSGPFGSLLNDLEQGMTTRRAFAENRIPLVRGILRAYRDSGATQPVTPTYRAAISGPHAMLEKFTDELKAWNTNAAFLTREEFEGTEPLGSVASLIDTTQHHTAGWNAMFDKIDRARIIHTRQILALYNGKIRRLIFEAGTDLDEAIGFVRAAAEVGMKQAIVSFMPREKQLLPDSEEFRIQSYADVLGRLQDAARGLDVRVGLNCESSDRTTDTVEREPAGTFSAVYPNQCSVPQEAHDEFFRLAHLNEGRTHEENLRFERLRQIYEIQNGQLDRMLAVCMQKGVTNVGLCCGASPAHIKVIAEKVAALTHSSSPRSLL